MSKIIYKHEYSHIDTDEIEEDMKKSGSGKDQQLSYEEWEKKYLSNRQLLLDKTRILGKQDFISAAIKLSELYELDILILECKSHISVELTIDQCVSMKLFKPLFVLADELTVINSENDGLITIYLDYYTHIVISNSTVISP